ncbi:hypothetical protein, conserved [Eimeria acervulina]|uniref:Uncharacterized protein n=1 Tax=Eimeria acervulina TaxID=5801 RepID=U6GRX2_EIMAC|nr:hypothetical protein, conserved [Eimeria acervulina]CDI82930.1 hypothetical protein, conserved [Eimeria acervulina]
MHNIPLSKAVEALVANTPSLYFSIGDFCQALEPLLLQQGGPPGAPQGATQGARGGPPAAAGTAQWGDRQEVRRALEEAFEEMQGSRCGAADALELLLGLSRYCSVDTADRIKVLLTPSIVDKFRRAQISFENVDDLALASAVDLFKGKYHFLTISGGSCCTHQGRTAATRATAAAAAAATEAPPPAAAAAAAEAAKATAAAAAAATECARKELFVDTAEEPWKTAAHYAGLTLSFEEFAQECRDTPKEASINATSLLRLPLIVALRGLY